MAYGIAGGRGQPDVNETHDILDAAFAAGITTLDTARAYGDAELRIGEWQRHREAKNVNIVTKIPKLPDADAQDAFIEENLKRSRSALQVDVIDVVMMHRAEDLLVPGVALSLHTAQTRGLIGGYGASTYEADTALSIVEHFAPAALQVPMNVADTSFRERGLLEACKSAGVTVFIRSVFLQGALLFEVSALPDHLKSLGGPISKLDVFARALGRTRAELLVVCVRDMAPEASLVIGVESASQLASHIAAIRSPPLEPAVLREIIEMFSGLDAAVIDPRKWPR